MYTLADYGAMIADKGRTSAYARALESHITPSSVVLDIGAIAAEFSSTFTSVDDALARVGLLSERYNR